MTEQDDAPRRVYLVAGGTPAALALARALDDPEWQAQLRESVEQLAHAAGLAFEQAHRALLDAVAAYAPALRAVHEQLVDAGVLDRPLPEDPRERALELRRRRSTGPDRQVQHGHRPRRIA